VRSANGIVASSAQRKRHVGLRTCTGTRHDHAVRVLVGVGLGVLFVVGAALGLVIGFFVFWVSLYRGARAVHAEGIVCRADLTAKDGVIGPALAGPALVRLSGAFEGQRPAGTDVLGLDIRMQRAFARDARIGDQDLLLGTFESFSTAARDRKATNVSDYLANKYSSVTPWWVPGLGPVVFRITPSSTAPAARGADRIARLDADLATDRARLALSVHANGSSVEVAELRLLERFADDDRALRASMFRQGRGVRPLGIRNGIRASVYPLSQLARRLRGG
jgi:hypothetical protein